MENIRQRLATRLRILADLLSPPRSTPSPIPQVVTDSSPKSDAPTAAATPEIIERFLHSPPQNVEVVTDQDSLQRLVNVTAATWTQLGKQKAHWSVLTWPEYLLAEIDEARFFQTGADSFMEVSRFFERSALSIPDDDCVLELGCGVGRVTKQLATHFQAVTAVDISAPHLSLAAKYMGSSGLTNVRFVQLRRPADLDEIPQVGFFYSIIVLQHNPPPVAFDLLRRCLSRVKSGGFAFFQIPTFKRDYCFTVESYAPDKNGRMEMHVIPQAKLLSLLQQSGFEILELQEDGMVGDPNMVSHTFFARRHA